MGGCIFFQIAGELLDFDEFIPAYATATDEQINKGVNYGSGGAGIRRGTGRHLVTEHFFVYEKRMVTFIS